MLVLIFIGKTVQQCIAFVFFDESSWHTLFPMSHPSILSMAVVIIKKLKSCRTCLTRYYGCILHEVSLTPLGKGHTLASQTKAISRSQVHACFKVIHAKNFMKCNYYCIKADRQLRNYIRTYFTANKCSKQRSLFKIVCPCVHALPVNALNT